MFAIIVSPVTKTGNVTSTTSWYWIPIIAIMINMCVTITVHEGVNSYTTYYEGDGPIIFLSQHGGYTKPSDITARHNGCYNSNTNTCSWIKGCNIGRTEQQKTLDADECKASTLRDSYTKEIADCLRSTASLNVGGTTFGNHFVVNNLHRSRLDANREINEAAMGNNDAETAWNEIHNTWLTMAKQTAIHKCGWGIIFDIHGQASNDYNQFGYRISKNNLKQTNAEINSYDTKYSSIYGLTQKNNLNGELSDIIRGRNSLGTFLENKVTRNNGDGDNYLVVPSSATQEMPGSLYYYAGGFALRYHGTSLINELYPSSKSPINVDVIQIEINGNIRWERNGANRALFCQDFSDAIITFINTWYDVSSCNGHQYNVNDDDLTESFQWNVKQIILLVILFLLVISCCMIGTMCYRKYKARKIIDGYNGEEIVNVELETITDVDIKKISSTSTHFIRSTESHHSSSESVDMDIQTKNEQ